MTKLFNQKSPLAARITSDLLLIILLHVSYFIIDAFGHKQLGFHLNDDTIKLPYKVDTVSTLSVTLYAYLLPILTVIAVELFTALFRRFAMDEANVWHQVCPSRVRKALEDVFLSFLSGHASAAAVGVTYAVYS
ncbi:hypothetical protein PHET_10692 [Paragonimus heterotremus]|uniref:Uncharacterized protein n=1 Tax=Paragonimus heterotremus TaxID=100268 RepID=A0A8J4WDU4_9TREM|nr:hypothetical protein PHET_10692 [Paragonimus heterotremus]